MQQNESDVPHIILTNWANLIWALKAYHCAIKYCRDQHLLKVVYV